MRIGDHLPAANARSKATTPALERWYGVSRRLFSPSAPKQRGGVMHGAPAVHTGWGSACAAIRLSQDGVIEPRVLGRNLCRTARAQGKS